MMDNLETLPCDGYEPVDLEDAAEDGDGDADVAVNDMVSDEAASLGKEGLSGDDKQEDSDGELRNFFEATSAPVPKPMEHQTSEHAVPEDAAVHDASCADVGMENATQRYAEEVSDCEGASPTSVAKPANDAEPDLLLDEAGRVGPI